MSAKSYEDWFDELMDDSETPITDALISRAMKAYPGTNAKEQAAYYEAVHQDLAPLARDFEKKITRLKAQCEELREMRRQDWIVRSQSTGDSAAEQKEPG